MQSKSSFLERLSLALQRFADAAVAELRRRGVSEDEIQRILARWKPTACLPTEAARRRLAVLLSGQQSVERVLSVLADRRLVGRRVQRVLLIGLCLGQRR